MQVQRPAQHKAATATTWPFCISSHLRERCVLCDAGARLHMNSQKLHPCTSLTSPLTCIFRQRAFNHEAQPTASPPIQPPAHRIGCNCRAR
jgi:hypothetical protein